MKTIYLLIGAKGSGKSFIGSLIQDNFNIPFLYVEDWVKEVKNDRDITNELYRVEAFAIIESGVREFLEREDQVVFESVGLTQQFEVMCESLKSDFNIISIGIKTDLDLCLQRVKTRNRSNNMPAPEDKIKLVNSEFKKKNRPTDYVIDNNNKSADELIVELKNIFSKT